MSRLCLHDVDERSHLAEVADHLRVGFMRLVFVVESVFERVDFGLIKSSICRHLVTLFEVSHKKPHRMGRIYDGQSPLSRTSTFLPLR